MLLASPAAARDWSYTIQRGDTLWTISEQILLKRSYWRRLQVLNKVADPRRLRPGSQLRIPVDWLRMPPAEVDVIAASGSVSAVAADGAVLSVVVGEKLSVGAILRTGADGSARLRFTDGTEVQIEPDADMTLRELSQFEPLQLGRSRVQLNSGGIEVDVPPENHRNGSRFQVTTPAASLAVRGTLYRARVDSPAETVTEVLRGEVAASNRVDQVRVAALFGLAVPDNRPLPRPQRLLPPPPPDTLPAIYERVPLIIPLPSLPGAADYRAQIATDDTFTELLYSAVGAAPQLIGPDLPDGDYVLRLRAVSADGVEGQDALFSARINARPEPPLQIAPAADDIARTALPEFVWADVDVAAGYRFQLASDVSFAAPLISVDNLDAATFTPTDALTAGRYFWRVAVLDDSGSGPFSDPIGFDARPPAAAVEVPPPVFGEDGLKFAWRQGVPGQRYQFQLSRDYWFSDLIVDQELDTPEIAVAPLQSDKYYLRIRVIEADGYRGEFGPRQEITVPLSQTWRALIAPALLLLLAL